ncbi:MAG: GAF domain-containing sensor histidine kinase [Chloroflexi bacterium]|nr:GAF domain-containing sensor histidine kinase [Chloroflexota bacterium]
MMDSLTLFFERNIVIVFFFYGLGFFSMGLAVWLELGRSSEFRRTQALLFLAGFGLLHGAHEWVEVYIHLPGTNIMANPVGHLFFEIFRVGLLSLSFLLLAIFGLRTIFANDSGANHGRRATIKWTAVLVGIWLALVVITLWTHRPCGNNCVTAVDVLSRYALAIPAAFLAAWAMTLQRRSFKARGMFVCARDLLGAALALLIYGAVGQLFTKPSFLWPSTIINSDLFQEMFGIPIQLFRAILAGVMAVFVIRALRAFELEREQRLAAANEAKLIAQQEALATQQRARAETEKLNRELQTAVQDLTMLFDLSRSLAATLDRDTLLQDALANIFKSIPRIRGGIIFLRENEERPLQQVAVAGYETANGATKTAVTEVIDQARKIAGQVAASDDALCWTGDIFMPVNQCICLSHPEDQNCTKYPIPERTIGIPLMIQDQVGGCLVLNVEAGANCLTARDHDLIRTVASQLSMAIANATLYHEVQAREELRGELLRQIVSAQESERQRIARELHDGTGQIVTALSLGLAAASASVQRDPELAARQLKELKMMSSQVIKELHNLVMGLRPSVLDDLGLVPALRGQALKFEERTQVDTRFEVNGRIRRIQLEIETTIFRIAQESLTNIIKHADARHVTMQLTYSEDTIQLAVQDDGSGFNQDKALRTDSEYRWGLLGMQERVSLAGGVWEIDSQPGAGTIIRVTVPIIEVVEEKTSETLETAEV